MIYIFYTYFRLLIFSDSKCAIENQTHEFFSISRILIQVKNKFNPVYVLPNLQNLP